MNAANRAKLQEILVKGLEEILHSGDVIMPLLGDSTLHHMANAVINIIEAVEDIENYIGDQLSDEERESIGI